jgi:phosphoglycerate dehydrogenase-like enzyme
MTAGQTGPDRLAFVNDICLSSAALLDRLRVLAPELELPKRAVVWENDEPPAELGSVRFWVPGPVQANPAVIRRAIEAMPALQVVQTQSAGVDNFVGVVPDGITLCDARGVHGSSTSEWALTAILAVLREFPRFERARLDQRWDQGVTDELAGKRVLIIGAGDVGEQLARRVSACDAEPVMVARRARPGVHGVDELPGLLGTADVVVLMVPGTTETIGMVDQDFLARMPDGALLVNAARGPVVRTDALLAELGSGRLRAALDVTDPEPLPGGHPLWTAPNLMLTPHIGGAVLGFFERLAALLAAQLRRFEDGQQLQNVVTGEY